MSASDDDPPLGYGEMAEIAGVAPDTIRSYANRRSAGFPAPDGRVSGRPWWRKSTFTAWLRARPGPGFWGDAERLSLCGRCGAPTAVRGGVLVHGRGHRPADGHRAEGGG